MKNDKKKIFYRFLLLQLYGLFSPLYYLTLGMEFNAFWKMSFKYGI